MTQLVESRLRRFGFLAARQLPDGRWAAVDLMLFTAGLFIVDPDTGMSDTRWCYEHLGEALADLAVWTGKGDPPGNWIKQKPEERLNPNWARS